MTTLPNSIFYGDNLEIMRNYLPDESVDLIYLDPPFNSQRDYNILFEDQIGQKSAAQLVAFKDTWQWGEQAEEAYDALMTGQHSLLASTVDSLMKILRRGHMMAYVVMMAERLLELHRVLKPTGSLYLHCDPTAGHYLRLLLDAVFGAQNFRNEIIWQRTGVKSNTKRRYANSHDILYAYKKSEVAYWNNAAIFKPYDLERLSPKTLRQYALVDEDGRRYQLTDLTNPSKKRPNLTYEFMGVTRVWRWTRERMQAAYDAGLIVQSKEGGVPRLKRYLDEQRVLSLSDVWTDIPPIGAQAKERLGYPTQKPVALLERIIMASSQKGDVVLDPFCGCGTAIVAAQNLGRRWIGIDITHLSVTWQKYRLEQMFDLRPQRDYQVVGVPQDLAGARALALENRYQFQYWALSLVGARPVAGDEGKPKKGKDRGIDGEISFVDEGADGKKTYYTALIQVKSGKVKSGDVRDFIGTLEREKQPIGLFLTLEAPSADMKNEALSAGVYASPLWGKSYRRVQILTIEDLLGGQTPDLPPQHGTFPHIERAKERAPEQDPLL